METTRTARGFPVQRFTDLYGSECSVQDSSLADCDAIWFGVDKDSDGRECTRMHLTCEQVAELLPALQRFVATGSITP
jgi:hypothetical protein